MRGAALIVLAWNQWPLTRRCLDSLLASELDSAQVIVVDNGSEDETHDALASYADRIRCVRLPENLGFVRGMNAGIASARPDDDVVLLNNDLVFDQRDWLNRLRDAAYSSPDIGIVGCRLLGTEPDDHLIHSGGFIEPDRLWGQQTESGRSERDVSQYVRTRRVQGIAFAVAYLRRDCIDRIGVLDEAFHSYYEDTDYCLRAADAGIATVVAGNVTLRHEQHGSTRDDGGFREGLRAQSRATFAARWQERLRDNYRGTVLWQGMSRFPHAQSQLLRTLLCRLDARGLRMAFAPTGSEFFDAQDFRLDLAAQRLLPAAPAVALVSASDALLVPNGRYKVGLIFGEWERFPPSWAQRLTCFDRLLVPDEFQRNALQASGVKVPINVLALGVERDYLHPGVPTLRHPDGACVFLAIVEDWTRDAPDVLVAAFNRAFSADEPVELVLHIRPGPEAATIAANLVPHVSAAGARVRVFADWGFPAYQRGQLIAAADVYVSARRGGGWDPVVGEALACGRPVVAPAFGSQEKLVGEFGCPVASTRSEDPRHPGCTWAEPDPESLRAQMRAVFDRREELARAGRESADAFAAAHDLDVTADRLVTLLAEGGTLETARPQPVSHQPIDRTTDVSSDVSSDVLSDPDANTAAGQIVVLGMHRSGTSSVAGLLAVLGAWPGPAADLLRGPDNPKGHFEHGELHMACLRRLRSAGGDWKQLPSLAQPAVVDQFRREAGVVLDTLETQRPWFIKEPRLCLLAHELLPLLTRPVFVHVTRDPREIGESLARRNGISRELAFALWERYTIDAFAASIGQARIIVGYAELLSDPLATANRLYNELTGFGVAGLTAPNDAYVDRWVDPALQHARVDAGSEESLSTELRALHEAIQNRSILAEREPRQLSFASARVIAHHATTRV
ncbi:MAG: glycosyltransferase [Dokdonella sp.]